MGKSVKEWGEYMQSLNNLQLEDIDTACKSLMNFTVIEEEYACTGIGLIGYLAKEELKKRGVK